MPRFIAAEELAGFGLPYRQIATLIRDGIGVDLLQAAFAKQLDRGKANASAKVARTICCNAIAGGGASLIWWTKAQLRWSETTKAEVSGPNGGEIPIAEIRRVSRSCEASRNVQLGGFLPMKLKRGRPSCFSPKVAR